MTCRPGTSPRAAPRVRLDLLHAERDALAADLVDVEHDRLDLVADVDDLRRVLDPLGPRHLADVHEALDARLELDERAVVGERDDLALHTRADRVLVLGIDPRILLDLLEAQLTRARCRVELEHLDLDLVADLEQLARVVDAAPRHVGDVEQAVDAAEVDEGAVVGEVLDTPSTICPSSRVCSVSFLALALLLEQHAARQHDVAALLVELDDLEGTRSPISLSRLRTGRRSTCEPGRNALTPMSTERPPFTRATMMPSTSSSRS
jgi:hypothetical protein